MANAGTLAVALEARTASFEDAMERVSRVGRRTGQRLRQSFRDDAKDIKRSMSDVEKAITKAFDIRGQVLGLVSGITFGKMLQLADEFNVLQQRIRTATAATGDFESVNRRLFEMANRNGAAFADTVSVYQSLARSAKELGANTEDMLRFTDTVQKLGAIGGSSTEQMKNGLLQMSQALAGGVVHAEEMNSIVENMPEIASRAAKGMGMTVGQLRAAVKEQQVTSAQLFQSLLKDADKVSAEFEKMPLTMGRSMTAFNNVLGQTLSTLDSIFPVTKIAAGLLQTAASLMQDVTGRVKEFSNATVNLGSVTVTNGAVIAAFWEDLGNRMRTVVEMAIAFNKGDHVRVMMKAAEFMGMPGVAARAIQIQEEWKKGTKAVEDHAKAIEKVDEKAIKLAAKQAEHFRKFLDHIKQENMELHLKIAGREKEIALVHALHQARETTGRALKDQEATLLKAAVQENVRLKTLEKQHEKAKELAKEFKTQLADQQHSLVIAQMHLQERDKAAEALQQRIEFEKKIRDLTKEQKAELRGIFDQLADIQAQSDEKARVKTVENAVKKMKAEELEAIMALNAEHASAAEKAAHALDELNKKQQTGKLSAAAYNGELQKIRDSLINAHPHIQAVGSALSNAFERAIFNGGKLSDVLKGLLVDLAQIAVRATILDPISKALSGALTGLTGGSGASGFLTKAAGFAKSIFGFASGGVPPAGRLSVVGENGPELLVGDGRARVVPIMNGRGSNQPPVVNVTVNAPPGSKVTSEERSTPRGRDLIFNIKQEIADDITNGGVVGRAISRTHGAPRSTKLR